MKKMSLRFLILPFLILSFDVAHAKSKHVDHDQAVDADLVDYAGDKSADVVDAAGIDADSGAERHWPGRVVGCEPARWGAAIGRRQYAYWVVADRGSCCCGRFATSYIFPSIFALRLIVF